MCVLMIAEDLAEQFPDELEHEDQGKQKQPITGYTIHNRLSQYLKSMENYCKTLPEPFRIYIIFKNLNCQIEKHFRILEQDS